MGKPRPAQSVKLFAGLLGSDRDVLRRARQLLVKSFGPVDHESDFWPFDQADYYQADMGPDLQRWFIAFERVIPPADLAAIKRETNALEERIADECQDPNVPRPVNIDPGYLDLTKLVLATTKDRGHRIYLGQGIYAEVTLQFTQGAWQALPWTYPDYRRPEYHAFFIRLRDQLKQQRPAPDAPSTAEPEGAR